MQTIPFSIRNIQSCESSKLICILMHDFTKQIIYQIWKNMHVCMANFKGNVKCKKVLFFITFLRQVIFKIFVPSRTVEAKGDHSSPSYQFLGV